MEVLRYRRTCDRCSAKVTGKTDVAATLSEQEILSVRKYIGEKEKEVKKRKKKRNTKAMAESYYFFS